MEDNYEYNKKHDSEERIAERTRTAMRAEAKADARVEEKSRTEGLKADERVEKANMRADARVAETTRVEVQKADARVARRGKMDDAMMESEMNRNAAQAESVNEARNSRDMVGVVVGMSIIIILMAGMTWGAFALREQSNDIDSLNSRIVTSNRENLELQQRCYTVPVDETQNPLIDTTRPKVTLLSALPFNNEMEVETTDLVFVQFSEPMDASTINSETFIIEQRTTPAAGSSAVAYRTLPVEGVVTYNGLTATFRPNNVDRANPLQPSQRYGNVFTATITTGVKDVAGNQLLQDYMWSFTTGSDPFNTGATTSQTS